MASQLLADVLRYLRHFVHTPEWDEQSDGQFLQRFIAQRDEGAFAALLQRHGPLVLGVCRQVLGVEQDAEDAFQATFLVLARKAHTIRQAASLAAWLHRVALNLSRMAKASTARRRAHERQAALMTPPTGAGDVALPDWQPLLHEEVNRLPEKYRVPVVLCYLEGKTHDEAARQLGWPLGTIKGRLARARDLLRDRLARRGLALSGGGLAAALIQGAAWGQIPADLFCQTLRAAVSFARGGAIPTGAVSSQGLTLAKGALQAAGATKLVYVLGLVLSAALLVTYSPVAHTPPEGQRTNAPSPLPQQSQAKPKGTDLHGDPLPPGALARLGSLRLRHGQQINAIAYAPDGKTVVSAGPGGSLVLHDAATGKRLRSFGGEAADAHGLSDVVAFAPDGKTLAAVAGPRLVRVWEVATGKPVCQFQAADRGVHYLAFSQDGRTLVGAEQGMVHVWDARAGKALGRIATRETFLTTLALAPDGRTLATAALDAKRATTLCLWETAGGRELRRWRAHQGEVSALAFSPDGKRLASASVEGETQVRVWAVPTGEQQLEIAGEFSSLRFSPCGKLLAAAAPGWVSVREADTGKEVLRIPREGCVWTHGSGLVAFRPDGKVLALSNAWTITLWEIATGKRLDPPDRHDLGVDWVMFLSDGKTVASMTRDTVLFWEAHTGKRTGEFHGPRLAYAALSPDGKTLAETSPDEGQAVGLWDTATGKRLRELKMPHDYQQYALTVSPDGKTLAVVWISDPGRAVRFWDVVAGKQLHQFAVPGGLVEKLAFSPDGKQMAVPGDKVRLMEVATGRELRKPFEPPRGALQVAFSADGRTLAATMRGPGLDDKGYAIQVWEVETGQVLCKLERRQDTPALIGGGFATLSPDGKSLVTLGKIPELWEVATGKVRGQVKGHSARVGAVAFSPDGRLLASGSEDSTVLVWDVLNLHGEPPAAGNLSPRELEALWADLAGADAASAYRALRALAAAPAQAVPFLQRRLRPAPAPDPQPLARLFADLDDKEFTVRENATHALEKLGLPAKPGLQQVLAGQPSLEVRRRVERILQRWEQFGFSPEELRDWRAVEVLEHLGTTEAREVLDRLGREGPDTSLLAREARAALERLRRRPATP
jgi:RNA polymerase sigma factor (sigma-70 family)